MQTGKLTFNYQFKQKLKAIIDLVTIIPTCENEVFATLIRILLTMNANANFYNNYPHLMSLVIINNIFTFTLTIYVYLQIILAALFTIAAAKPGIHSVAYSAPLVAAPVAAAYTAPVAAAYTAPVAAAYTAPVAAAYTASVAAAYTAPVAAAYASPYAAAYTAPVAAYGAYSAPLVAAAYRAPVLLKWKPTSDTI